MDPGVRRRGLGPEEPGVRVSDGEGPEEPPGVLNRGLGPELPVPAENLLAALIGLEIPLLVVEAADGGPEKTPKFDSPS